MSDVKYDIALSLDKSSMDFYANATIKFQLSSDGITEADYKYIFLNFTNGGCKWICDDLIINQSMMIGTNTMFFNNRINFSPILKELLEITPKNEEGKHNMEVSI